MGIKRFVFHICGEQNMNLPHLSRLSDSEDGWPHPSILSFGQEVDLLEAARLFPEDIIQGNIDPSILQVGTPQEIYKRCRVCIDKGMQIPAGFVLAPGCDLPPRAPSFNIWAMTKAVKELGYYQ